MAATREVDQYLDNYDIRVGANRRFSEMFAAEKKYGYALAGAHPNTVRAAMRRATADL